MRFNIKDIVLTTPEYGGRKLIIVAIDGDYYWAKEGKNKYKITDSQIQCSVGVVESIREEPNPTPDQQREFCLSKSKTYPAEREIWLYLSKLRTGDQINLIHRNSMKMAFFSQINLDKPLRPIRAILDGKLFDFSLRSLIF